MSWGYVAVAAGTVIGGYMSGKGAKDGAKAQGHAADAATAETSRQYDQTRADFAPWRQVGGGAINQLGRVMGIQTPDWESYLRNNPDVAADPYYGQHPDEHYAQHGRTEGRQIQNLGNGAMDFSSFMSSPDYNFRRTEGQRGIEGTFAARGMGQSGNALRALTEFNSGLAGSEFGNYFNRLAGLAGAGQTATDSTAGYGANASSQAGRNALIAGNARASGIQGQADAWGETAQGLSGLYGYYKRPKGVGGGGYGGTGYGGNAFLTPGYGDMVGGGGTRNA